ncbi:hypothetical protein E1A91_A12G291600v1 [Gossypium mustelinum]|uniref:Uncharacterized protein n=1 Tax=Gossypium mustelinum TaxID=34275 RepID=A0A5D2X036_GOSMU|nr:hypothetical protein E1A91_A12G291600v1 [Gossypium mustelinum]
MLVSSCLGKEGEIYCWLKFMQEEGEDIERGRDGVRISCA